MFEYFILRELPIVATVCQARLIVFVMATDVFSFLTKCFLYRIGSFLRKFLFFQLDAS